MLHILNKFIDYLKTINKYDKNDFKQDLHATLFNLDKLKELIKVEFCQLRKIKKIDTKQYIYFNEIPQIIINLINVRYYWIADLHIIFELSNKIIIKNLELLQEKTIKYSHQYHFTYTLSKFLYNNFPTMTLTIEDNFLDSLNENITVNKNKGMRVDIVIKEVKIIIEYDEKHHENYDNIKKDEIRDCIIKAYGYEVIRYKESEKLFDFFSKLHSLIKEQEFIENPNILGKFIIEFFINQGYRKDIIEKLTSEIVLDIINEIPYEEIGKTPRNIKLRKDIFDWLFIDSELEQNKISNILENDISEPYINIDNDYILSPDAFEELLIYINADEYSTVLPIRKAYIDIKKKLLQHVYMQTRKLKSLMDTRLNLLQYIANEAYERGKRDNATENKNFKYENEKLMIRNNILEQMINNSIPKDKRGFIKNKPIIINKLEINKPIVPEIPQLIYTSSVNDYVEEEEIKIIFEQNRKNIRINISFTKCIENLRKILEINNNSNPFIANVIYYCKFNFKNNDKVSEDKTDNIVTDVDKTVNILTDTDDEEEF